ncbi:MAG: hypothetical protein ACFE85_11010 [Candidatus Hodarchaeota archaeon]
MSFIEPSFEIDEKGRVLCQSHSHFPFFKIPDKTYFQEKQMENLLTCKSCIHYKENDCFFPKSEINKIELDRLERKIMLCKLCGNRIDRMLSVIHKLYFKERFNIEIPLICCSCYDSLKKNEFIEESKRKTTIITLNICYLFILLAFSFSFSVLGGFTLIVMMIGVVLWCCIFINYIKRLNQIKRGRKYYEKYFKNN